MGSIVKLQVHLDLSSISEFNVLLKKSCSKFYKTAINAVGVITIIRQFSQKSRTEFRYVI